MMPWTCEFLATLGRGDGTYDEGEQRDEVDDALSVDEGDGLPE
jgi:hypothetical protein